MDRTHRPVDRRMNMTLKAIRAAAAALALAGAAIGGQALAQDHGYGGYDRSQGFERSADYGRGYDYGRGDPVQRFGALRSQTQDLARAGQLDRRESARALNMLGDVSRDIRQARRDGVITAFERQTLNTRLDQVASFIRDAQHDGRGRLDRRG